MNCCPRPADDEASDALTGGTKLTDYTSITDGEDDTHEDRDTGANGSKQPGMFYGYIILLLAILNVTAGMATSQALNKTVPHSELNGLRYTLTLLIAVVYLLLKRKVPRVPGSTRDKVWVFAAAFCFVAGSYTVYGLAFYMPLGTSMTVYDTLEIAINLIANWIILRTFPLVEFIAALVNLAGVFMVTQPKRMFQHADLPRIWTMANHSFPVPCQLNGTHHSQYGHRSESEKRDTVIGTLLCFAAAVFTVSVINITRYKLPTIDMSVFCFWVAVVGIPPSVLLMYLTETPTMPTSPMCQLVLALHILMSGTLVFLYLRAGQLVTPVWVSLVTMLNIPLSFILQYTVLSGLYPGNANVLAIVGIVVVISGNVIIPINILLKDRR